MKPGLDLPDLGATEAFGIRLGQWASAGEVFALVGDIGAGKTSLTRGIAVGLAVGNPRGVTSPTFALWQIHAGPLTLHHLDWYRLSGLDEVVGLGVDEVLGVDGVCVIEWPNRAMEAVPVDAVWIELKVVLDGAIAHRRLAFISDNDRTRSCSRAVLGG